MDFAPASAANSGEAVAGICKGRQPLTNAFFGTSRSEVAFHLSFDKEMNKKDYLCSFFATRQKMNQKSALRGSAPKYPGDLARYAKSYRFLPNHARLLQSAKFAFAI